MKNLLYKEFRLATPLLTFMFLGFAVMTFIPGYPILCGAFFVCLGLFQGYQLNREAGDIMYSVLLPVKKTDVVKAKYAAAVALQMIAFVLFAVFTLIRMVLMSDAEVYTKNVLMTANPVFLAFVLLIFALFNVIFLGGFFKTAYAFGKPFITFIIACFVVIAVAEALHHFPGLEWMNTLDFGSVAPQTIVLLAAVAVYAGVTMISCRKSQCRFEMLDM